MEYHAVKHITIQETKRAAKIRSIIESRGDILCVIIPGKAQYVEVRCGQCDKRYTVEFAKYEAGDYHEDCPLKSREARRRYILEDIREYVSGQGERLLSDTYPGYMIDLDVECRLCGCPYRVKFGHYLQKRRHTECLDTQKAGGIKYTTTELKKFIGGRGDSLVKFVTVANKKLLQIRCGRCTSENILRFAQYAKSDPGPCKTCAKAKALGGTCM